jgi:deoxyribodipyrimidine photolyase-related protein
MLGIVFPHQLFAEIPSEWTEIIFVRHDIAYGGKHTTVDNFHIARKVFFRAAEKAWMAKLPSKIKVRVVARGAASWGTKEVCQAWDPVDHLLEAELAQRCPNITLLESPAFVLSRADAITLGGKYKTHVGFYGEMRRRTGILMTREGKPDGGKLRYDAENRERVGPDVTLPDWDAEIAARESAQAHVKAAHAEVVKEGASLGTWSGELVFPVTRAASLAALKRFVRGRLAKFGPYQDAIVEDDDFLFHSVLSAPINAGLLTASEVIAEALSWKDKVPLSSLEGFIAQILGWREFMRAVYYKYPRAPANRLGHRRSLSPAWYEGKTGLLPVDVAVERVVENAYLHHIERLMVVGNAMFLCQIQPDEVYRWFMEMFADSYDWVMIGNVYYMSQWASDAITTKPYISSSGYLLRMSNYTRGAWCEDWDALYWAAVDRHSGLIRKNYRLAAQVAFWERKTPAERKLALERAERVVARIGR